MEDLRSTGEERLLGPDFVFGRLETYLEGSKELRRAELLLDVYHMHKPDEYTDEEWARLQSDYPAPDEAEMQQLHAIDTVERGILAHDLKMNVADISNVIKAYNAINLSRALGREKLFAQGDEFPWDLYAGAKVLANRTGETYLVSTGESNYSPPLIAEPTK